VQNSPVDISKTN